MTDWECNRKQNRGKEMEWLTEMEKNKLGKRKLDGMKDWKWERKKWKEEKRQIDGLRMRKRRERDESGGWKRKKWIRGEGYSDWWIDRNER